MLRLVLLLLYLVASFSLGQADRTGNLDPDGLTQAPPTADSGGGLDPDGLKAQAPPTADVSGGLDPNG